MTYELKSCPFCAKPLTVRNGVNSYGRCDTEGCWMAEAKIGISCDDPKQVDRWNTRPAPAATDTGLETVGEQFLIDGEWFYESELSSFNGPDDAVETRALCDRSQAEELLAAERAENERAWQAANNWLAKFNFAEQDIEKLKSEIVGLREALIGEQSERRILETDNAALTARVKELEELLRISESCNHFADNLSKEMRVLEAKLAAAEADAIGYRSTIDHLTQRAETAEALVSKWKTAAGRNT